MAAAPFVEPTLRRSRAAARAANDAHAHDAHAHEVPLPATTPTTIAPSPTTAPSPLEAPSPIRAVAQPVVAAAARPQAVDLSPLAAARSIVDVQALPARVGPPAPDATGAAVPAIKEPPAVPGVAPGPVLVRRSDGSFRARCPPASGCAFSSEELAAYNRSGRGTPHFDPYAAADHIATPAAE